MELENQISTAKVEASDPDLIALARHAIEVVRYAVASLPPESNKGWPYEALRGVAGALPRMPDATQDHRELATTLEIFAVECERFEVRRKQLARGEAPQEIASQ